MLERGEGALEVDILGSTLVPLRGCDHLSQAQVPHLQNGDTNSTYALT